jgi:hypothetical protein
VLGFRDKAVPGATHILAAAQGAGGEAAEDKDQDIVYEDVYFVPLIGGLLHHLDDVVERGRQWKRQRCCLNQSRSTYGDVLMSSLMIRWKLDSYVDEIRGEYE